MKDKLTALFNTMKHIETKGDSTLIMADCLRELAKLVNEMEQSNDESDT